MLATHGFRSDGEGEQFVEIPELNNSGRSRTVPGLTPGDLAMAHETTDQEKFAFLPRILLVLTVSSAPWLGAWGAYHFVFG